MKKIICIGECSLDVILHADGTPSGTCPGGCIAMAAAIMAADGIKVLMASEASADAVGNLAIKPLEDAGVDTHCIDRFTEGHTPLNIIVDGAEGGATLTRYEGYPNEAFDIVWPRIDEGDVVVFGGYYAIDPRMRPRQQRLLAHALERKAILIYLPGFMPQQQMRITRVMPQILENLEMAHIIVVRNGDLSQIFSIDSPEACYRDCIDFYCRSMVSIDESCRRLTCYSGKESSSVDIEDLPYDSRRLTAGIVAGLAAEVLRQGYEAPTLDMPTQAVRTVLLTAAAKTAATTVSHVFSAGN